MKRYQIAAYLIVIIGLASVVFYGVCHYSQAAYTYQIAKGIPTKLQEGSFLLTMNPQPFLYPGVALIIIGMAMVFYDAKKKLSARPEQPVKES